MPLTLNRQLGSARRASLLERSNQKRALPKVKLPPLRNKESEHYMTEKKTECSDERSVFEKIALAFYPL
jgi:hypothetical protein